jgi:hypothetical protein
MKKRPAFRAAMVLLAAFALGLKPPPSGKSVAPTPEEAAARDAALRAFGGKIVWSSNREGSHDIWILDGPGKESRRLTHSAFTDTYPRFSPDGRLVSFSRSTEPWVSQRNFDKWDTWVVDVDTGRERRVATNAYQACWHIGDYNFTNLVFVRDGGKVLAACKPDGTDVFTHLSSGHFPIGEGELITIPDMPTLADPLDEWNEDFLVTLRGARRATIHIGWFIGVEIRETAGGCQMVWRKRCCSYPTPWLAGCPTNREPEVVWVDHPGRMKNAFYTFDYSERAAYKKRKRVLLFDAPEPWSHEYFPRFAEGGRWLVYGASQGGHEQDSEDYEIFLWDSANTNTPPARLTFHTGNDCWPDIWAK